MGGDGGVVATNRRYMRGAGSADHTGDYNHNGTNEKHQREHQRDYHTTERVREIITTCSWTQESLFVNNNKNHGSNKNSNNKSIDDSKKITTKQIVACSHGFLYHKEAMLQGLLHVKALQKRLKKLTKQNNKRNKNDDNHNKNDNNHHHNNNNNNNANERECQSIIAELEEYKFPTHITKLSDLYNVRLQIEDGNDDDSKGNVSTNASSSYVPTITCPLTGKVLLSSTTVAPAGKIILLVPGNEELPNVISASAISSTNSSSSSSSTSTSTASSNQISKGGFQLSKQQLQQEYGPIEKEIVLVPNPIQLRSIIIHEQEQKQEEEELQKNQCTGNGQSNENLNKKQKKRKKGKYDVNDDNDEGKSRKKRDKPKNHQSNIITTTSTPTSNMTSTSRSNNKNNNNTTRQIATQVQTAMQSNPVFSSLFTSNHDNANKHNDAAAASTNAIGTTEKERKDNLFARM